MREYYEDLKDIPIRNKFERSATGNFMVRKKNITGDFAQRVVDEVFLKDNDYLKRYPDPLKKTRDRALGTLLSNSLAEALNIRAFPGASKKMPELNVSSLHLAHHPRFNYNPGRYQIFSFFTHEREFDLTRRSRVEYLIGFMKRAFRVLKPEFGWCDLYDYLLKFDKKDPREGAFGLMFYGKEMVEQLGRDRILGAPVYAAEEMGNGIMLQLVEHPFSIQRVKVRNQLIKHLGLKRE